MNKVILMGRLTKDPEIRYTQSNNTLITSFTVAVNRKFVKQGEERQVDFINVVAWSKTGEFVSKYFKKGQQISLVGSLQVRTWEDEQKKKHYATEIIAEEVYFCESKKNETVDASIMNAESTPEIPISNSSEDSDIVNDDDLPF